MKAKISLFRRKKFSPFMLGIFISALLTLFCVMSCANEDDDAETGVTYYTVSFNADGGSTVTMQTVESGKLATEPKEPTKTGYTFAGWYKDGARFDFSKPITANITLIAHWTAQKITYTITFNANGGTITTSTQFVEKGVQTTLLSATTLGLTRTGYTFIGWATAPNTAIVTYTNGAYITLTTNLTLYALWKEISAPTDDNTGSNTTALCTYIQSTDKYTYYIFYADKTAEYYYDGKLDTARDALSYEGDPTAAGTVTLKTNTGATLLTFNVSVSNSSITATAYIGNSTLGGTKYSVKTESSGNDNSGSGDSSGNNSNDREITYTITFYPNGGTLKTSTQTVEKGVQTSLYPATTLGLIRTGYDFAGWATTPNTTTVTYADGAPITLATGNLTLYALWAEKPAEEFTVIFATNDGGIIGQQIVTSGATAAMPAAPVKDGYIFAGWYTDSSLTMPFDFSTPITANIYVMLYAKWEKIPIEEFTVTFITNGGSIIEQQIVASGATAAIPTDTVKTGYMFAGWYSDSSLLMPFDFTTPITANITLYAKWEEISAPIHDTPNAEKMFMGFDNVVEIASGTDITEITTTIYALTSNTTLKFTGGINSVTLTTIAAAMGTNDSVNIALDFSETTGITEWTNKLAGVKTLYAISLPNTVTSVQKDAFTDCTNLKAITVPCSITAYPSVSTDAIINFVGTLTDWLAATVTLPYTYYFDTGRVYYYYTSTLYLNGKTLSGTVTIPSSVTTIKSAAFVNCAEITRIVIPSSVTTIENGAFAGCSGLTNITIPSSVTNIGGSAFSSCSGLTSITIPDGVTSIGNFAFNGCSGLTSITIPNSVTNIGSYAFNGCSGLTSITIPDGVTSIGTYAFSDCTNLTTVNYRGTESQWAAISIRSDNSPLTSATIVYNYTGD